MFMRRSVEVLIGLSAAVAIANGGSAADRLSPKAEVVFEYRPESKPDWWSPYILGFEWLPDDTMAVLVAETPGEAYLHWIGRDGKLMHRTLLGDTGHGSWVNRAVIAMPETPRSGQELYDPRLYRPPEVIVASSGGQVWRVSQLEKVVWESRITPGEFVDILTGMAVLSDGAILLGGSTETDSNERCGRDAIVTKMAADGRRLWTWRFDLPSDWTFATELFEIPDGYLVFVEGDADGTGTIIKNPNCDDYLENGWLVWLDRDGVPRRLVSVDFPGDDPTMAILPNGYIALAGVIEATNRVVVEIRNLETGDIEAQQRYAFDIIPSASRDLVALGVESLQVAGSERVYLFVYFGCLIYKVCPDSGIRAVQLDRNGQQLVTYPQITTTARHEVLVLQGVAAYLQRHFAQILRVPLME